MEADAPIDLFSLSPRHIPHLPPERFRALASKLIEMQQRDRKENALLYYQPVSEMAREIHTTTARTVGVGGGNGSSKTEGCLAEMLVLATGIVPVSLQCRCPDLTEKEREQHQWEGTCGGWPLERFRGPVQCRVVCESLTTVLHPILLKKLQWFTWTGIDVPGGERGHWGWVPRTSLIQGSWERSWSEKLRMLRILGRDPKDPMRVLGESSIQFMSVDQDPSDFASGDFHMILHDEPPGHTIWREDQARTMRVAGRNFLAMTWPDDPSIPVDWIFDEVYEPGLDPENKDVNWINLFTTDNPNLDQSAIAAQSRSWSPDVVDVRIYGRPIRFSNRIHPEFTDEVMHWCFDCNARVVVTEGTCRNCQGSMVAAYSHVESLDADPNWPTVWLLDPHPRKPHMWIHVQVTPWDDLQQVAEGELDDDPQAVAEKVLAIEESRGLRVCRRLIDPNMGRSPSSAQRGITWQDEFDKVQLRCDLADDSDIGRSRVNEYLKPDPDTLQPRMRIDRGCPKTIHQFKRYIWDDYRRNTDKDQKQSPKTKNDDYPTLWKYLLNSEPTFRGLGMSAQVIRRRAGIDRRHHGTQKEGSGRARVWSASRSGGRPAR